MKIPAEKPVGYPDLEDGAYDEENGVL